MGEVQELEYVITLTHRDRGVGVCAQQALRNSISKPGSPVRRVEMVGRDSHETVLRVILLGDPNGDYLRNLIERSGRMPSDPNKYSIRSIQPYNGATTDSSQRETLEARCDDLTRGWDALKETHARLHRQLAEASAQKISSPQEAMLRYFHTLDYKFDLVVDEKIDKEFIQKVFKGDLENTVHAYYQYSTGKAIGADDFTIACAFDVDAEMLKFDTLLVLVNTAREELAYIRGIEEGHIFVPAGLKDSICSIIRDKNHEETIQRYEDQILEFEELKALKERITNAKKYYDHVSAVIELLQQNSQSLPVLFSKFDDNTVEVYFPFIARGVKTGLLQDLYQDLKGAFPHCEVQQTPNDFLAYTITIKGKESCAPVEKLLEEPPLTLLLAGYNTLTSYRLGI